MSNKIRRGVDCNDPKYTFDATYIALRKLGVDPEPVFEYEGEEYTLDEAREKFGRIWFRKLHALPDGAFFRGVYKKSYNRYVIIAKIYSKKAAAVCYSRGANVNGQKCDNYADLESATL